MNGCCIENAGDRSDMGLGANSLIVRSASSQVQLNVMDEQCVVATDALQARGRQISCDIAAVKILVQVCGNRARKAKVGPV